VIGHNETGHDLALDDMALHDFRHVGFGFDLVPHTFGINYNAWPLRTMIKTPGFIRADDVLQVQPLRFLLKVSVERFRSKLGATPTGIVWAPLIRTDKDVTFVTGHDRSVLMLEW
jgi:hypothetical protein